MVGCPPYGPDQWMLALCWMILGELTATWSPSGWMSKATQIFSSSRSFRTMKANPSRGLSYAVCQHTLSLHSDDHTVCFMVKINNYDHKAWVIVVDMKNNNLQGVVEFAAGRYTAVGFAYLHSRISKYLRRTPGNLILRLIQFYFFYSIDKTVDWPTLQIKVIIHDSRYIYDNIDNQHYGWLPTF